MGLSYHRGKITSAKSKSLFNDDAHNGVFVNRVDFSLVELAVGFNFT